MNSKSQNQGNCTQNASLWAKLQSEYKLEASLEEIEVKIKKWKSDTCPCRLCKKIKPNLGFLGICFTNMWIFFALLQFKRKKLKSHPKNKN